MIDLETYQIKKFPYTDHKRVDDIINYEGPILSLFVDESQDLYLYYWIDSDQNHHRWLISKVQTNLLINYFDRIITLKELLTDNQREYTLIADQNNEYQFENSFLIRSALLPEQYLPAEDSYFSEQVPEAVSEMLSSENLEEFSYLQALRGSAIYLKLQSNQSKYKRTLSLVEVTDFLRKINTSFVAYTKRDFTNSFFEKFNDLKMVDKYFKKINEELSLRPVQLAHASFGIGLSVDRLGRADESKDLIEWKQTVLKKFEEDVLGVDSMDEKEIENLTETVSEEDRSKIYDPIIKIYNDPKVSFYKTDMNFNVHQKFKSLSDDKVKKIIPVKVKVVEEEEYELVNIVIEKPKGKDVSKINLKQYMLFSQIIDSFPYSFEVIKNEQFTLNLTQNIEATFNFDGQVHEMRLIELELVARSDDKDTVIDLFQEEFIKLYNSISQKSTLNKKEEGFRRYLETFVRERIENR